MAVKRISPAEAHQLMNAGYEYIDVRSVPEFEAGHPSGARNVPLAHAGPGGQMSPNPEFMAVMVARFARDAPMVLGCRSGARSQRAAMMLEAAGFANLVEMRGGMGGESDGMGRLVEAGWAACGLPVSAEAVAGASWQELKSGG